MTKRARIVIIVLSSIGLVLAFFAAKGSEEADNPPPAAMLTQTTPAETGSVGATGTTTAPAPEPAPQVPVVVVRNGEPRGGVQRIEFRKGEQVRFHVSADVADHVHVHGFDVMRDVAPGKRAKFSFEANIDGRYEVELEDRGIEIAQLVIRP